MNIDETNIENILVKGLSDVLKRTLKVSPEDRLAIAQEYKEWVNCVSASDFFEQEILVINNKNLGS